MDAVVARPRPHGAPVAAVAVALVAWLAFAMPVAAEHGRAVESNGNSGTIKIHAGVEAETPMHTSTEPHPGCFYHIHGFHFAPGADVVYTIHAWSPDDDQSLGEVDSGSATADDIGDLYIAPVNQPLPNGHYKAIVDRPGAPGDAPDGEKQKVFWIECDANAAQGGGVLGGQGGAWKVGGSAGGGVLGGAGGPSGGMLPDTAVPMELAGSLGGLLLVASGIAYSVNRRRDS